MSGSLILILLSLALVIFIVTRIFVNPLRVMGGFLLQLLIGLGLILLANLLCRPFGLYIPLNPYNILITGYLNLPGILLLLSIRFWL